VSNLLNRHEVMTFLWLIVIINALFVTACAEGFISDRWYNYGRFALLGGTMLGIVYLSRGWKALLELFRPLTRWRIDLEWYLLAALWAFSLGVIVLAGKILFGEARLNDMSLQLGVVSNPRIVATLVIGALVGEIVWISYSIKQLSQRHTIFVASLIVGAFWTAWWLPMAHYDYGIIPGLNILPLWINQTGVALMCGLIYYHTRSALCVLVLQVGVNTSILVLPVLPTTGGETTYWAFSVVYFSAAVLAYLYFGPQPLFQARKPAEQPDASRRPARQKSRLLDMHGHLGTLKVRYIMPTSEQSK